ncbi:hypothetical protein CEXT_759711 [Caerostris extrusa]|uniref:Uncharacterized protein n=1 Tax=Caerostris extrusa TaxID=172846 RepID=A0AAV4N001_CAEEX|nr:hypothetical protein CEXT_759711 [Caerostris extrusa]
MITTPSMPILSAIHMPPEFYSFSNRFDMTIILISSNLFLVVRARPSTSKPRFRKLQSLYDTMSKAYDYNSFHAIPFSNPHVGGILFFLKPFRHEHYSHLVELVPCCSCSPLHF